MARDKAFHRVQGYGQELGEPRQQTPGPRSIPAAPPPAHMKTDPAPASLSSGLHAASFGLLLAVLTVLFGQAMGIVFGANEDAIKSRLKASAATVRPATSEAGAPVRAWRRDVLSVRHDPVRTSRSSSIAALITASTSGGRCGRSSDAVHARGWKIFRASSVSDCAG